MQESALSENVCEAFAKSLVVFVQLALPHQQLHLFLLLLLVRGSPGEHTEQGRAQQEGAGQTGSQAEVDHGHVQHFKGVSPAHEVHDDGVRKDIEGAFPAPRISVKAHHLDNVGDADGAADGRIETEDDKVTHVCSSHAMTQEVAVMVQDKNAPPEKCEQAFRNVQRSTKLIGKQYR